MHILSVEVGVAAGQLHPTWKVDVTGTPKSRGAHAYLFSFAESGQTPKVFSTVVVMVGHSVLRAPAPALMVVMGVVVLVVEVWVVKVLAERWCRFAMEAGRTLLWF